MTAPVPWASGMRITPARLNRPWEHYIGTIWTGTGSNPSVGNGNVVLRWRYVDDETVEVRYIIRPGSTTTFGSGNYGLTLPVAAASGSPSPVLQGTLLRGSNLYPMVGWVNTASGSASALTVYRANVTATEQVSAWTPTAPATFASGDSFQMYGRYFYV